MKTKQYIKEINKYMEELSKENQLKFGQILLKLRFSKIKDNVAEEFAHHCLDLFLQAEDQKIPVEEVLGHQDLNVFCEEFIVETRGGYSWIQKIYWKINIIPIILLIFTGIFEMFLGYLLKEWIKNGLTLSIPFTLSMVMDAGLAIIMVEILTSKAAFFSGVFNGDDKKKDRFYSFLLWLGFCALTGLYVLSKLFLPIVLFKVNYLAFMGVLIFINVVQYILENRNV